MGKLFKELKQGLQDILAYMHGRLTLKSEFIEIPEPRKEPTSKKIKKIRNKSTGRSIKSK